MTPEQFCYWLQGLLENKPEDDFLSLGESQSVRNHLSLVFEKITPFEKRDADTIEAKRLEKRRNFREQQITNAIHQTKRYC